MMLGKPGLAPFIDLTDRPPIDRLKPQWYVKANVGP